jgi:hypothetical protein
MEIKIRTTLVAAAVAATFIGTHAIAVAQDSSARNIEQYTCKDIMRESDDSRTTAIAFLHGFLLGKSGSPAFDVEAMAKQTDSFVDYCLDHPNEKAVAVMMKSK